MGIKNLELVVLCQESEEFSGKTSSQLLFRGLKKKKDSIEA
jgi:hypothetical protein